MKILPIIAGEDPLVIRDLIKGFCNDQPELTMENDRLVWSVRKLDVDYISTSLSIDRASAAVIQKELIEGDWISEIKLTPTRRGMALAQHIDRPNIARDDALAILEEAVSWAERTNAESDGRVIVKSMYLYGSLQRGEASVGDVDLFVSFTTMDIENGPLPEDMDQEDHLCAELAEISEYLSPASELEHLRMSDVPTRQVFPRP
jgi:hypothetical protein